MIAQARNIDSDHLAGRYVEGRLFVRRYVQWVMYEWQYLRTVRSLAGRHVFRTVSALLPCQACRPQPYTTEATVLPQDSRSDKITVI